MPTDAAPLIKRLTGVQQGERGDVERTTRVTHVSLSIKSPHCCLHGGFQTPDQCLWEVTLNYMNVILVSSRPLCSFLGKQLLIVAASNHPRVHRKRCTFIPLVPQEKINDVDWTCLLSSSVFCLNTGASFLK